MASSNGGVPPGFRFHPTDEELLHYYLKKKVTFQKFDLEVIREVDLNKMEPWDLQERCKIGSTPQNEWYFFSHKDRKYPTGSRTNRATNAGFWKATGRDKCIRNSYQKIGMRKTLVFYRGRAPHGQKSDWIMHEYRLEENDDVHGNGAEDGWVVCRVFKKKNLFKVGNEGSTSLGNGSNGNTRSQSLTLKDFHCYDRRQDLQTFDLYKQADLPLHYPQVPVPHFPNLHHQLQNPTKALGYDFAPAGIGEESPAIVKQFLPNNNQRGCESATENMGGSVQQHQSNCDHGGLQEVGSSSCEGAHHEQMIGGRDEAGLNDWAMLDRLVSIAQEDPSKGNGGQASQINQLSFRGEMDLWGYSK